MRRHESFHPPPPTTNTTLHAVLGCSEKREGALVGFACRWKHIRLCRCFTTTWLSLLFFSISHHFVSPLYAEAAALPPPRICRKKAGVSTRPHQVRPCVCPWTQKISFYSAPNIQYEFSLFVICLADMCASRCCDNHGAISVFWWPLVFVM